MAATQQIRVMLVDDHPITIRGLREVLDDTGEFEIVAQAADGDQAVAEAQRSQPDVVVMDAIMPRKDGVEACREILDLLPDTKVLMLTASTEDDAVICASAAGAAGFVHKYSGSDDFVEAVREVAEGRLMIPDDAVRRAFAMIRSGTAMPPSPQVLTDREQMVLRHFAAGMTYAQMADVIGVSKNSVRNAIYRIRDKLQVGSKQEIVVWAVRSGLLDAQDV